MLSIIQSDNVTVFLCNPNIAIKEGETKIHFGNATIVDNCPDV